MANLVTMRWSKAAKVPRRSWRLKRGLADQDAGEGRGGVHLGVGQQAQLFELGRVEQVGLVDDDHHPAVALGLFGGEQVGGLGHDLGLVEPGLGAQGPHDGDVEAPGAKGRVGHVDHLVPGRVEPGHRRRTATVLPARRRR